MKLEDIEERVEAFFSYIENSLMITSLLGYVEIIAILIILNALTGYGYDLALRLADFIVPITFFALSGVFFDIMRAGHLSRFLGITPLQTSEKTEAKT